MHRIPSLNRHIYDTDEAKIAFILSFLNEGEAYKWREAYLNGILDPNTGYFVYPPYSAFITLLQAHFRETNQVQVANNQLATIKQGKKSVEDFIAEFRLLLSRAEMTTTTTSNNLHLINYFRRGLNQAIARKITLS